MVRKTRQQSTNSCRSSGWKLVQATGRTTEKAAVGLARWATTDHTGLSRSLCNMPSMGLADTLKYLLMQFLISVFVTVVSAIWVFFLIAIVLPYLITVAF